ncbi:MAG TPA: hypothetical protein VIK83_04510, partial [Coriobacteriia bacterium]
VAAVGIALMAPRGKAATAPATSAAAVWSAVATATATVPASATPDPTPAFASFRGVQLRLPVEPGSITVVAFHQSSFNDTYVYKPLVKVRTAAQAQPLADAARAAGCESLEPTSAPFADGSGVWTGWGLQVWRTGVNGRSDTAVDCGAPPGTPVISPVTGTVMRIRPYKLYGRINDFEFNIKADAWNDVDVIVLHVTDPVVKEGDRLVAGVTRIASVRRLTKVLSGMQLRTYTSEGGNHTHVQLNKITKPNETWVVGKDPPGLKRNSN